MTDIIDVSHWQGKVDFAKVKASGIKGAYIKATQGIGAADEMCLKNATAAFQSGIQFGYYHFASLNDKNEVQDAKAEAEYFIKVLKTLPTPSLPVVLDIEDPKLVLTKDEVLAWINTFFDTLEANGVMNYILYSYAPWLDKNLPDKHNLGSRVRLWLAAYVKTPRLPKGWDKYWLWQYSCEGSVPGVNGRVDLNVYGK